MAKTITQNTEALGQINRTKLKNLIKEHGSQAAVARHLNVSPTTVRSWAWRLRVKASKA